MKSFFRSLFPHRKYRNGFPVMDVAQMLRSVVLYACIAFSDESFDIAPLYLQQKLEEFVGPRWLFGSACCDRVRSLSLYADPILTLLSREGTATGVEYLFDKRVYPLAPQDIHTVKARRLVVVSAGAMGSPGILERSGVGRKDVLEKAGVPVVSELSGVGENYQGMLLL